MTTCLRWPYFTVPLKVHIRQYLLSRVIQTYYHCFLMSCHIHLTLSNLQWTHYQLFCFPWNGLLFTSHILSFTFHVILLWKYIHAKQINNSIYVSFFKLKILVCFKCVNVCLFIYKFLSCGLVCINMVCILWLVCINMVCILCV